MNARTTPAGRLAAWRQAVCIVAAAVCGIPTLGAGRLAAQSATGVVAPIDRLVGQAAGIAGSAYLYRADRKADENPPESWILLMQYAGLPFDKPVRADAPALKPVRCGLLWEEVRPVRRVELSWPAETKNRPAPEQLRLAYFDATDGHAHTWWNPRTVKEAGPPDVSADGRTYVYTIPHDTWGVVVAARDDKAATAQAVPSLRALVPDTWKRMEVEIEWGFEEARADLEYDGRIEAYDGVISGLRPLNGASGTTLAGPQAWRSAKQGDTRRGVQLSLLYIGSSRWRRVWPYHAQAEDVARTIVTVRTKAGSFSFQAADLELGPILAPEYGFFVRGVPVAQPADTPSSVTQTPAPAVQTLTAKVDAIAGNPSLRGWGSNDTPWFGSNATDQPATVSGLTVPPRSVAMHPGPDRDVAVGWRSPFAGRVRVTGKVTHGHPSGGNGIEWWVAKARQSERQVLAQGAIDRGGAQSFPSGASFPKLGAVAVEPGDMLSLVIGARDGSHACDTTIIELAIAEVAGQRRVWDLTKDVCADVQAGNPHADAFGHPEIWHFYTSEPVAPPTASSQPPFRLDSRATTARDFIKELAAKRLATIRQRVRQHPEQTWTGAVQAMHPGRELPPHPQPPLEPAMQVQVPCERLTAQWKLGAWHILRRSAKDPSGKWRFNDFPFGILASETYMILRALDLQGMHREAADGLEQWLQLPLEPRTPAGSHDGALPDRPLGHFADGKGCLTHAAGIPGAGGHMDAVHCMGPGAIMFTLIEHAHLTGDRDWLQTHAPRMKANVEWILRQRRLLAGNLPGGQRLWSKGLQPAHVVTPDSMSMHMQFYESEAYYWLAVKRLAELLKQIDPADGNRLAAEAEAYRQDLLASLDRSITLTPVVPVRDGTYRSFIPFAPYVRGFAAGAWGWRRCQGHVGAIYWDTVQSADPLISPAELLPPEDPRVQGHLDVLEDRLLLENTKIPVRTPGFDPEKHWFAHASWQYQCGLERHANIHLAADDPPNAIRSWLNQYAVDIMPGEYTFREHTTGGPPDKIYEESCFLERFRMLLVMEAGRELWLARATPRVWLEQGKRITVRNAPTHFGAVDYEITSDVAHGRIAAGVNMPARTPPRAVLLRLRHPQAAPIRSVTVNGRPWQDFDASREVVRLVDVKGRVAVEVRYGE
jgi:hypothetical protein